MSEQSIEAYPLCWPVGWPRKNSHQRASAKFGQMKNPSYGGVQATYKTRTKLTVAEATQRVLDELHRLGVRERDAIISTNLQLRQDGLPRSGQRKPDDPGVAVYWTKAKAQRCMAIDRYDRVEDNLAAVAATLDAMRAIERHGGAEILDRAFTGFTALPAPGQTTARGWREVFGFAPGSRPTPSEVQAAYRKARADAHPDRGGTSEKFHAVETAYSQAVDELVP